MNNATAARHIRNYWDWRASSFDDSSAQQQSWWQVYNQALGTARDLHILDVGTGTGFIAMGLAGCGHRVTALDVSPAMLRRARIKAIQRGQTIRFLAADASDPPFAPAGFDAVVCRNLLWTLPDPARALNRWHRLIKPGGRIIVSDGIWRCTGLQSLLNQSVRLLASVLKKGFNSTPLRFELMYRPIRHQLPHFQGVSANEAEELLISSGFAQPIRHEHHFPRHPYPADYGSHFFVMSAIRS
jgi:SAM-dependent methyltransferase